MIPRTPAATRKTLPPPRAGGGGSFPRGHPAASGAPPTRKLPEARRSFPSPAESSAGAPRAARAAPGWHGPRRRQQLSGSRARALATRRHPETSCAASSPMCLRDGALERLELARRVARARQREYTSDFRTLESLLLARVRAPSGTSRESWIR